jgi:hypothetical protein
MRVCHKLLSTPGARYEDLGAGYYDKQRNRARQVSRPLPPARLRSNFRASEFDVSTDYDLARTLGIDSRAITAAGNLATRRANGGIGWAPQLRELLAFGETAALFTALSPGPLCRVRKPLDAVYGLMTSAPVRLTCGATSVSSGARSTQASGRA